MQVVALVSGGKDSVYCAMRARAHGHEVAALANLFPPAALGGADADSHMYQTVGHECVGLYARCMNLPLFRKEIRGGSKNLDLVYRREAGDEVEDLRLLLREVVRQLPGVRGVCSGAIRSDYQRTRVEAVCADLGLVSYAFLWRRPQDRLLGEMVAQGLEAVLVKVAGLGLEPGKHLGRTLGAMRPHLLRLHERFGCHVCGEGGEFESLTLDCPLFEHGRLDALETEAVAAGADAGYLKVKRVAFVPKRPNDERARVVLVEGDPVDGAEDAEGGEPPGGAAPAPGEAGEGEAGGAEVEVEVEAEVEAEVREHAHYLLLAGRDRTPAAGGGGKEATEAALRRILVRFEGMLAARGLDWSCALYVHFYLADMALFPDVNAVYRSVIPLWNPPARCCVEVPFANSSVAIDVLCAADPGSARRSVLHVQSVSEWAPPSIGPYSQSASFARLAYLAGQIGLDPASMALVLGGLVAEARRAMRSCECVARAIGSSVKDHLLAATVYHTGPGDGLGTVEEEWATFLREPAEADPESFELYGENEYAPVGRAAPWGPAALTAYVQLPALPKGAAVEIQPVLYLGAPEDADVEEEEGEEEAAGEAGGGPGPFPWWPWRSRLAYRAVAGAGLRGGFVFAPGTFCTGFYGTAAEGGAGPDLAAALRGATEAVLADSGLGARDVVSLRVYSAGAAAGAATGDRVAAALGDLFAADGPAGGPPVVRVPAVSLRLRGGEACSVLVHITLSGT